MGKKYIIELEDNESVYKTVYKTIIADEHPILQVIVPTPYTEPDLEQVRKEAFEKGYSTAVAEQCAVRGAVEKAYQRGLNDAWEAARKISLAKIDGGFSWESMNNMFGTDSPSKIYKTFTASEAIEKIRQYEQEKEEQIQVGDEVKCIRADWTAIVTKIKEDGHLTLMGNNGAIANGYNEKDFIKTGRHFPEISEVLRKMKENSDG